MASSADPQEADRSKRRQLMDAVKSSDGGLRLEWNEFFVLKEASLYLNLEDLGNAMLTCQAWRHCIVSTEKVWTFMLENRYPNIRELRSDSRPKGRAQLFRRLQLERDAHAPVRTSSKAWPDVLRTPPRVLMNRWKPESIVFLIDMWRNGTRIFSISKRLALDHEGKLREPDDDDSGDDDHDSDSDDGSYVVVDMRLEGEAMEAAECLAKDFLFAERNYSFIGDRSAASSSGGDPHLSLSYQLEGDQVPTHAPIVLLSERKCFWYGDNACTFQTDVEECWVPSPSYLLTADQYTARKMRLVEMWKEHAFRYGCSPLPFDPDVKVTVSPRSNCILDVDTDGNLFYSNDKEGICYVHVETSFQLGEDYFIDFSTRVFPTLLSLCEDATK